MRRMVVTEDLGLLAALSDGWGRARHQDITGPARNPQIETFNIKIFGSGFNQLQDKSLWKISLNANSISNNISETENLLVQNSFHCGYFSLVSYLIYFRITVRLLNFRLSFINFYPSSQRSAGFFCGLSVFLFGFTKK